MLAQALQHLLLHDAELAALGREQRAHVLRAVARQVLRQTQPVPGHAGGRCRTNRGAIRPADRLGQQWPR